MFNGLFDELEPTFRAEFPYSVTLGAQTSGFNEPIEWLHKRRCYRCFTNIPPFDGDYVFLTAREFLFKDERIAIEFKMHFG